MSAEDSENGERGEVRERERERERYPVRYVNSSFFSHKLQHSTVGVAVLCSVTQLKQHWVANVESRELLQS